MGVTSVQLGVTVFLVAAACVAFAALYLQAATLRWRIRHMEADRLEDGARLSSAGDRASSGALRSFAVVNDAAATVALSTQPFSLRAKLPAGTSPCGGGGSPTAEFTERAILALEQTPAAVALKNAMMSGHVTLVALGGYVCVITLLAPDEEHACRATLAKRAGSGTPRRTMLFGLGVVTSARVPGCPSAIPTALPISHSGSGSLQTVLTGARLLHLWGWGRGAQVEGAPARR